MSMFKVYVFNPNFVRPPDIGLSSESGAGRSPITSNSSAPSYHPTTAPVTSLGKLAGSSSPVVSLVVNVSSHTLIISDFSSGANSTQSANLNAGMVTLQSVGQGHVYN